MSTSDIRSYLSLRASTPSELLALTDADLEKYINTASLLLNTFYKFGEEKNENIKNTIIAEEALFLFISDFDLNLFYQYEGLKQFSVEGAIAGQVAYDQVGELFSRIVKSLLKAAGIEQVMDDPGAKVKNTFTWL